MEQWLRLWQLEARPTRVLPTSQFGVVRPYALARSEECVELQLPQLALPNLELLVQHARAEAITVQLQLLCKP